METLDTIEDLELKTLQLKKAAMVFRAVNNGLRRQMLNLIHKNGKMKVTDIYVKLRLEQSVTSAHLAILRREDIVKTEREKKCILYSVNYERLKEVGNIAGELIGG